MGIIFNPFNKKGCWIKKWLLQNMQQPLNMVLLRGNNKCPNAQAIEKATTEYRKYQNNTLSPVEHFYLDTIKSTAKEVKRQTRGKKSI